MTGIYKITINDYYIYIGQSVDIENRWRQHLTTLQNHKHSNHKLQSIYDKFSDKIKFEIIEECDESELDDKEVFYIEQFKSYNTDYGLNLCLGGNSHRKYKTQEERNSVSYKHIAILGLRNNNPKYTTNFYTKIVSSRNLYSRKNQLKRSHPDYTIEIIENHIDINISDDDLENKVKEYEKSNFIFREKSRQSKFEQSKSEIKQFEQSDLQEFSKYVNKLKLNITIDIQSNRYFKKKYNPYTKSWFVEKEISFDELVTMILHKEESKVVYNKENTITENPELIQQLQDKDKEIENLKKQNQELNKQLESMNNIELENEIIQLKKEIKELKSQLNSAKEQPISSAAKSDNSTNSINPIKSDTTKIEVKCHDDDLFNSMFVEEDNKSQSPTSADPKADNVTNTNVTNTNVITNNTNNSNQIDQTQKFPNVQRFRGSSNPYKQDITDDELYALAAAL